MILALTGTWLATNVKLLTPFCRPRYFGELICNGIVQQVRKTDPLANCYQPIKEILSVRKLTLGMFH